MFAVNGSYSGKQGKISELRLLDCDTLTEHSKIMTLLDNAVSSIRLALQDFNSEDERRLLSAVRNLNAGILLLYKAKLSFLSPPGSDDVLIKKDIIPVKGQDGQIVFVGTGTKTVDVDQIQKRFKTLGISTDWKKFNRINKVRNDIEHHFTDDSQRDAIRGAISDTFLLIRDFISRELGEDPMTALGQEAWSILISVSEVFEKEHEDCQEALEAVDWESRALGGAVMEETCPNCGSKLLAPRGKNREEGIECRSCGEHEAFEDFAGRALSDFLGGENHWAVKDGGEEVLIQCPFCFQDGYVVEEERCAICGEGCEHTCDRCASRIPVSELNDGGLCGWCSHMMSKDD